MNTHDDMMLPVEGVALFENVTYRELRALQKFTHTEHTMHCQSTSCICTLIWSNKARLIVFTFFS